jgi:HTH-type transcriptional regulator/antitoxin MqsA
MKMKCTVCAKAELLHDTRDIPRTYKSESTVIPCVTGNFCPSCGEAILDATESARSSAMMLEFNRQVNTAMLETGAA